MHKNLIFFFVLISSTTSFGNVCTMGSLNEPDLLAPIFKKIFYKSVGFWGLKSIEHLNSHFDFDEILKSCDTVGLPVASADSPSEFSLSKLFVSHSANIQKFYDRGGKFILSSNGGYFDKSITTVGVSFTTLAEATHENPFKSDIPFLQLEKDAPYANISGQFGFSIKGLRDFGFVPLYTSDDFPNYAWGGLKKMGKGGMLIVPSKVGYSDPTSHPLWNRLIEKFSSTTL